MQVILTTLKNQVVERKDEKVDVGNTQNLVIKTFNKEYFITENEDGSLNIKETL